MKSIRRLLTLLAVLGLFAALAVGVLVTVQPRATAESIEGVAAASAAEADPAPSEEDGMSNAVAASAADDDLARPEGWDEASHGNSVVPNYEVVFPQDEVKQLTITISPEDWAAMQANMTELYGERGQGRGPGFGGAGGFAGAGNGAPPEGLEPAEGFEPPEGVAPPGGAPAGGFPGFGGAARENPMWVAATIEFEGQTWTNVGVRYKGNSSLMSAWNSDTLKLPLKLDFDEFEDVYPEIDNQRFYGFKQLSLSNNFGDLTAMRDTITYDLLEAAGLPAAETASYEILIDYGEGPVSLGLYTVIEVIDDTVVERSFGGDDGNIYEADGPAASFAAGTGGQIATSFEKENNRDEADWSDIEALYDVLHAAERTTDPEAWRAELEAIFDVDSYLDWLALSAMIQHWDTYGGMTHNYYLYHDPETGRLTWISWDHNLVLADGVSGIGRGVGGADQGAVGARRAGGPGGRGSTSLDRADVEEQWPLILYLLDDPVYYDQYIAAMRDLADSVFDADALAAEYAARAEILAPYADVMGTVTYQEAIDALTTQTYARAEAVAEFLAGQPWPATSPPGPPARRGGER